MIPESIEEGGRRESRSVAVQLCRAHFLVDVSPACPPSESGSLHFDEQSWPASPSFAHDPTPRTAVR